MSELILQKKAKQLCRSEGKAWSLRDFVNGVPGVTMLTVVADEKKRRAYDVGGQFWERAMKFTVTSGAGVTASAGLFCGFRAALYSGCAFNVCLVDPHTKRVK
jgi:hypothetical protein